MTRIDVEVAEKKRQAFEVLSKGLTEGFSLYPRKDEKAWFEYYGNPNKKPEFLQVWLDELRKLPGGRKRAVVLLEKLNEQQKEKANTLLKEEENKTLDDILYEKEIEDILSRSPKMVEADFKLIEGGRQYSTEIGRIDLLGKVKKDFVVVEIKRGPADDRVIGQILRYVGWVHQKLCTHDEKVRGIVMAGEFPKKVHFARLGLLRPDNSRHIGFKKHPLAHEAE